MTWREFLVKLRETEWVLISNKPRTRGEGERMITMASDETMCPVLFASPKGVLERSDKSKPPVSKADIYRAADNAPGHDPEIREALLRACRLTWSLS